MESQPSQMNIHLVEDAALSSTYREVRGKVQAAIFESTHTATEDSSPLKERFHSEIWPSLYPDYEKLVNEVVRYCREELKRKRFDCLVLGRAKTAESVKKSLDRREEHRDNPYTGLNDIFETMHDLAGSLIIMQYAKDVGIVNELISQSFQATKPPTHWSRDRQPGPLWASRFGGYESYNHHVTLGGISDLPRVTFEIQVTTCSDFMYNRLAHDWYYKKAHGPMCRKDEIVMDMLHGAAIIFEVGGEYMRERQEENYGQIENEYGLIQATKLVYGTEEWQLESENPKSLLEKLKSSGYDSFTKIERVANQFWPLGAEDTSSDDPIARLHEIISQPFKRHLVIPFEQKGDFIGRESSLEQLLERIPPSVKKNECQRTAIEGLGGVGKTRIALEAAYLVYERYQDCSIFWVPAINMTSFENAYRDIGKVLDIPGIEDDEADIKSLVKAALEKNAGTWLLVIDNADDADLLYGRTASPAIRDYLPFSRQGSILFTTRNHEVAIAFEIHEKSICVIENLAEDEAIDMLGRSLKESQMRDVESTKQLLASLAYLPLAIKQASAYMARTRISTTRYLDHCRSSDETQVKLLSQEFEDRSRYRGTTNPIATTWLISFNHIARDYPLAARYLKYICFLAEKDIPISLLPPGKDRLEEEEALGVLTGYAFIARREQGDSFDIHRLVRLAMRNYLQNEERIETITNLFVHLSDVYPHPTHENRNIWMRYMPHAQIALKVRGESVRNIEKCSLLCNIAYSYRIIAKYKQAEHMYREAVKLSKEGWGVEDPKTLVSMNGLGWMLYKQGKDQEAEQIILQTLKLRKKLLGPKDPDTLDSMHNLACVFSGQGKYEASRKINQQTLKLRKEVLGLKHPETLRSMGNLAQVLHIQGNHQAEEMKRQMLKLSEEVLGHDHPDTLHSMSIMACILLSKGKHEEADLMNRRAFELTSKVLGPKHPDVIPTISNLAKVLEYQGKYKKAEKMKREALELSKEVLGPKHPDTISYMNNLATVLYLEGKYEEAEQVNLQVVELSEEVLGSEHPDTVIGMNNLAVVLACQGKHKEAEQICRHRTSLTNSSKKLSGSEGLETRRFRMTNGKQKKK
ncbi:uncharacterized protein F4807DRAFT_270747 [Annulohypoxylon truncatum]|uniref:uncharacterized protein n=1 Tax=Annulohypoxylon truncatum TaxID=327061 RepID=UPI002008C22E|nr:uncharacterized protein F4807DRAFT_270747 [Annulohypoxylon truncatum]KAI1213575.1 hypothetical protein F4807DRAFT_270747 [Annulohypoxylon truncatum]